MTTVYRDSCTGKDHQQLEQSDHLQRKKKKFLHGYKPFFDHMKNDCKLNSSEDAFEGLSGQYSHGLEGGHSVTLHGWFSVPFPAHATAGALPRHRRVRKRELEKPQLGTQDVQLLQDAQP